MYWRRRAVVLAVGIGAISFLVWSVTGFPGGAGHASGETSPRAGATPTGHPGAAATRAAASHPAASHGPRPSPSRRAAGNASSKPSRTPAGRPAATRNRPPAATGSNLPAGLPPACAPRDVVLSVAASRGSYGPGSLPQFEVYVVSLSARDCSVNIGPRYLGLVIKAGGTSRVWASGNCAPRPGTHVVQLSRGVPRVVHFSWDRKASAPGCQLSRAAAQPGTYTATAVAPAAHLASRGALFVLSAPGVGMP